MRDVEDLIYRSLRNTLATDTGVPSGRIWAKWPAIEFVNKPDGINTPVDNPDQYPAISMTPFKNTTYAYNNYGESIYQNNGDGTTTAYNPLAEIHLSLIVTLFTASKKDQREIGVKLLSSLLKNKLSFFSGDIFSNEYYSIKVIGERNVPDTVPYQKAYIIECCSRIFDEVTSYTVDDIQTNLNTLQGANIVSGAIINVEYDPNDPLALDTYSEFNGGIIDRTAIFP